MAYKDLKDLPRGTTSDKVLCDKAFNIDKNPRYDTFFDKNFSGVNTSGDNVNSVRSKTLDMRDKSSNQQLAEELHKSIIRKIEK